MCASAIATLIVSVSVSVGAARAHAQAPEAQEPPPGGLAPRPQTPAPQGSAIFAAADARGLAERSERLNLLVQLFGGYDDDVLAQQSSGVPPTTQQRLASAAAGLATGVGATITYSQPGLLFNRPQGKGDFRGWLDSSLRYYPALDNLTGAYHRFGLELSAPVTRRVKLYASPRGDYSPRYSFELLSGPATTSAESPQPSFVTDAAPQPGIDYSVVANNSFRYGVAGAALIEVGTRSTLSVDAGYSKRQSNLENFDMEVRDTGVSFDHQFSRDGSLELGYSYVKGVHGTGLETTAHNIDIGADYRRPLSHTRRTFLSFDTGSTIAESEVSGRRVQAVGSASLVHYVKRTWTGKLEYRRRLQYLDGFDRPLFGDAVTTGVNGLLSRRLELSARAAYTSGTVGLSLRAPRFESYTASARLRRALSRTLAGYVEAIFYRYSFDDDAPRPPGLPREFDRLAFRCGLSVWVPLLR
jgi:hypothetical protein